MARMTRRSFLATSTTLATGSALWGIATPENARPQFPSGVASGDIGPDRAMIWSRTDRPARMIVEYSTTERFDRATRVVGPAALETSDFTARVDLRELPPGQTLFYRVMWQDLGSPKTFSEAMTGRFRTPSRDAQDISFVWGGDTCGQGWGIDTDRGGMAIYESMRQLQPHFFLHSGDTIYADNPLSPEVQLDDGTLWKNLITPAKRKVAETLDEFRGNHAYNLLDVNMRAFNAEVPMIAQWDDHETTNNWFPGEMLDDPRYTVKSASLLAARAGQAFREYMPMRYGDGDAERIYRAVPYGPLLDLILLDQRSYRGPNTPNRQETASAETAFMGAEQIAWLKRRLLASRSTWKVIASDMPIGLVIGDKVEGQPVQEGPANGDGPPLGRELEIAEILRFIRDEKIRNVVWLTADVHYAAAHYYDPAQAKFREFLPFWEFVGGPLHAGSFGPNALDNTFGPQVKFHSVPADMKPNRPPSEDLQFFGQVRIDGKSGVMTVSIHNRRGKEVYRVELPAERA